MAIDQDTIVRALLTERARLFAFIWSIVRDLHIAEDVFQEVSLLALNKREEIESAEALPHWFRGVARHKALKAIAAKGRSPVTLDDQLIEMMEPHWAAAEQSSASDAAEALRRCLGGLNENNRRLVTMRYAQGMSGVEVAKRLNRTAETVYKALSRVHNTLADCVRRRMNGEITDG